jgi:hypothetical protein
MIPILISVLVGIADATRFSEGLIPPAITGLHNGDALRAWLTAGVKYVVGDNTRPVLMNQVNEMWPLISTVGANGYAGVQINPRWATNIYYNVRNSFASFKDFALTFHSAQCQIVLF